MVIFREDILHTFAKLFTSFHTACFIQLYKSMREQKGGKKNLDHLPEMEILHFCRGTNILSMWIQSTFQGGGQRRKKKKRWGVVQDAGRALKLSTAIMEGFRSTSFRRNTTRPRTLPSEPGSPALAIPLKILKMSEFPRVQVFSWHKRAEDSSIFTQTGHVSYIRNYIFLLIMQ